jgi:hypothetical protein
VKRPPPKSPSSHDRTQCGGVDDEEFFLDAQGELGERRGLTGMVLFDDRHGISLEPVNVRWKAPAAAATGE